jgi:hypothetical protein
MPATSRRHFLKTTTTAAAAAISARAFAAPADGWIELFDGKSLTGWHKNPMKIGHGTGGNWQVEDGTITGEQDPPGSGNGGSAADAQHFAAGSQRRVKAIAATGEGDGAAQPNVYGNASAFATRRNERIRKGERSRVWLAKRPGAAWGMHATRYQCLPSAPRIIQGQILQRVCAC